MFKVKLTLMALLLTAFSLRAQTGSDSEISGVFLTEADYRNNKLSNIAATDERNHIEIRLRDLMLVRNGVRTKLKFGSVYGYFQNGLKYRAYRRGTFFSDYGYYQVIDDSGLTIYSKVSSPHKSPGRLWYYYSEADNAELFRITKRVIKKNFRDHSGFAAKLYPVIKNGEFMKRDEQGVLLINAYYNKYVKK